MMTVKSGESVTKSVRIVQGPTTVPVPMATFWSKVMSAKPMCQVGARQIVLLKSILTLILFTFIMFLAVFLFFYIYIF